MQSYFRRIFELTNERNCGEGGSEGEKWGRKRGGGIMLLCTDLDLETVQYLEILSFEIDVYEGN